MTQLLVSEENCEQTVAWLACTLAAAGLRVASSDTVGSRGPLRPSELGGLRSIPSFDLFASLAHSSPCPCPNHNSTDCSCQVAIVLVHDPCSAWAALVAHSHGARTWAHLARATADFPLSNLVKVLHQTAETAVALPSQALRSSDDALEAIVHH